MDTDTFFKKYFDVISDTLRKADAGALAAAANEIYAVHKAGGKVIVVGNGGSAAIASHVSVDLTKAAQIRAINFNESDLLTCYANDYGYDQWVLQALQSYADHGDLVILVSSSGKSPNIVSGATRAKSLGLKTITLSGFSADNPLRSIGDINLWVDSSAYNVVEMTHLAWLLSMVDYLIALKNDRAGEA